MKQEKPIKVYYNTKIELVDFTKKDENDKSSTTVPTFTIYTSNIPFNKLNVFKKLALDAIENSHMRALTISDIEEKDIDIVGAVQSISEYLYLDEQFTEPFVLETYLETCSYMAGIRAIYDIVLAIVSSLGKR